MVVEMVYSPLKYNPIAFANSASGDMLMNLDSSSLVYIASNREWSLGLEGGCGVVLNINGTGGMVFPNPASGEEGELR